MYRASKDGISALNIPDTRTQKLRGLYPAKVQMLHTCIQKYYTTAIELSINDLGLLPEDRVIELSEHLKNIN